MAALHCAERGSALLHIAFNQDNTCVVVSDMTGLRVFSLERHKRLFRLDIGAINLVGMLFCTSLLAYVGAGEQPTLSPRRLTLFNTHTNSAIQSLSFPSLVLALHMNRSRLVVVLQRRVLVYTLETLELLHTIDTGANLEGVSALTGADEALALLALPAGEGGEAIRVYDISEPRATVLGEMPGHRTPLAVLAWNDAGTLLASASQKGTVIRVHCPANPDHVLAFRRGSMPARISGLAFSPTAVQPPVLCVSSNHGTVHIFSLPSTQLERRSSASAAAAAALTSVLPTTLVRAVEPTRCLHTIRLGGKPSASACALSLRQEGDDGAGASTHDWLTLTVATASGLLYSYKLEGLASGSVKSFLEGEWFL